MDNQPAYLANAKPNPAANRAPWYQNTAPAYAGIILWFVFWQDIVNTGTFGGGLAHGIWLPIVSVVVAALLCHFLFYLVPGLLGMKTGLPLYVIGSGVFGARGGIIMPGLLMGLLQFGWVAVNIYFSSLLLSQTLTMVPLWVIMVAWGALATFMGLKGIQYVAKVSTYLPLIPLVILLVLLAKTVGHVKEFSPEVFESGIANAVVGVSGGVKALSSFGIFAFIVTYVVGFFATAGAAGADFGTNARHADDVQKGGLFGVTLMMIFTGVVAVLIISGIYGANLMLSGAPMQVTDSGVLSAILGGSVAKLVMFLLALAAFPAACFSSLIAANSFKTMLPKVNANISVAIGGAVAIVLAVTGVAGKSAAVFGFIGASFGPICGALLVDYFLNGKTWGGARAGFNPAGWAAWALGFTVGVLPNFGVALPLAPVAAFAVGAGVYYAFARLGLQSKQISRRDAETRS
ncbi:MAG: cytosine permease [Verrucomicrobiales bacterium]|jgi:cytosine permease|nr:cytosine permease [Verrucomicrobiales bacterium]